MSLLIYTIAKNKSKYNDDRSHRDIPEVIKYLIDNNALIK